MTAWRRLAQRNPLPGGAVTVGVGLLLAGVCTYAFLAIAGHALTALRYSAFASFWALLFVVAPGIFLPLEQELARAISARRARGDGGGPVVRRVVLSAAASCWSWSWRALGFGPIDSHLLGGDGVLMVALLLGLTAYCAEHIGRGTLSGNGRFRLLRDPPRRGGRVPGAVLRWAGAAPRQRPRGRTASRWSPGPSPRWSPRWHASAASRPRLARHQRRGQHRARLAAGGVARDAVPLQRRHGGGATAGLPSEECAAGTFLNGRVLAFVPLFLFQAVTAALLPRLSALHSRAAWLSSSAPSGAS